MSCALRSNKISMNFNFRVDDLCDNDTKKFVDLLETFSLFKRFCLAPLIYRAIPTTTLLISDHSDHLGEWGRVRGGGGATGGDSSQHPSMFDLSSFLLSFTPPVTFN